MRKREKGTRSMKALPISSVESDSFLRAHSGGQLTSPSVDGYASRALIVHASPCDHDP